ncbi:hypothetical protein SD961_16540 [Erwinia sp. MMLR14_017]|uniref:hypothetical protein n=1 Tax=Erwinia sp. MMLR14_017 TaxID=3093842 RepID=UPI00298FD267|nr:hypothetical protein [Erwinia sp. MMLR14_017]MDW8847478.1 hypothetical protein [Erwinia sp. MMLR14_017]
MVQKNNQGSTPTSQSFSAGIRKPVNAQASVGMPKLVQTPSLGVSLESLESLIEKRRMAQNQ